MKKLQRVWLVLMCLLIAGLSIPGVYATEGKSRDIDVNAKYKTVSNAPASYSVDLLWSDMTFTYTREDTLTWNAKDHSYQARSSGGWDKTRATITVTNHSNVDVRVTITYTPVENTGITGVLRNATGKLDAGKVGDYDGADSMTATLVISGTPTNVIKETETKIGSLKVTIE